MPFKDVTCKAADRNDSSSASNEPMMYPVRYSPTSSFQLHNLKERSPEVLTKSSVCLLEGWCGLLIGWAVWRKVFCIQPEPVQAGPWLALDSSMKVGRWTCSMWIYQIWHSKTTNCTMSNSMPPLTAKSATIFLSIILSALSNFFTIFNRVLHTL